MMRHTYDIEGMHSESCRSRIEKNLNAIPGIEALVTTSPAEAVISMTDHVPLNRLQEAVSKAGNYRIRAHSHSGAEQTVADNALTKMVPEAQANPLSLLSDTPKTEVYTCPMHPEITSDKPGNCPKCGMRLEKKKCT